MQPFISTIRVSYSDTDQMGFVHHSNYLKYYESARWNLFRHLGIPYREIEETGVLLPVVDVKIQYIKPAFYDQKLLIETTVVELKGPKLVFNYKLFNEEKELINTGTTTLAFVNVHSKKPCKPLPSVQKLLQEYLLGSLQTAD